MSLIILCKTHNKMWHTTDKKWELIRRTSSLFRLYCAVLVFELGYLGSIASNLDRRLGAVGFLREERLLLHQLILATCAAFLFCMFVLWHYQHWRPIIIGLWDKSSKVQLIPWWTPNCRFNRWTTWRRKWNPLQIMEKLGAIKRGWNISASVVSMVMHLLQEVSRPTPWHKQSVQLWSYARRYST